MVFYNMADGRAFTFYEPNCDLNKHLLKNQELKNTHDYRRYLQQNAIPLMKQLAECAPIHEKCEICPVCNKAVTYTPDGNIPAGPELSTISTNPNPYNLNPNI